MVEDGNIKLLKLETAPCIRFENISFKYPNSDNYVIKDLSLHIEAGEKIRIDTRSGAYLTRVKG